MKAMKQFSTSALLGYLLLMGIASPVFAQTPSPTYMPLRKAMQERKQEIKSAIKDRIAQINSATVVTTSSTSFTITKDGKTYTVTTTTNTKYRRHFWGTSSLAEIASGNTVSVIGKWTDEEKTTLEARLVRNLSVMKRYGVFIGTIKSISEDTFVLSSKERGDQTVTLSSNTVIINRKEERIAKGDLLVGQRIRVKGVWDKSRNTISEVREIKDYSLPVMTSPTPTP